MRRYWGIRCGVIYIYTLSVRDPCSSEEVQFQEWQRRGSTQAIRRFLIPHCLEKQGCEHCHHILAAAWNLYFPVTRKSQKKMKS